MRNQGLTRLGTPTRRVCQSSLAGLGGCLLAMLLGPAHASPATGTNLPMLQFVEPTNNAVFSMLDEVPIMLRAWAPDDVFISADVLANHQTIGSAVYCCPFCPCARPLEGQETILQIPVPWEDRMPPPR